MLVQLLEQERRVAVLRCIQEAPAQRLRLGQLLTAVHFAPLLVIERRYQSATSKEQPEILTISKRLSGDE